MTQYQEKALSLAARNRQASNLALKGLTDFEIGVKINYTYSLINLGGVTWHED